MMKSWGEQMKERKAKGSIPYMLGMISYNMEYLIVCYLTYALTNSFGISAITSGSIFLFSRIFDGVSDIIAGVIIDKCNSKLGKARVYDLLHIPLWLCVVVLFSVPNVGTTAKVIWVFVFYNILQSVIATFINIAEPIRLQKSFVPDDRVKVMTITSSAAMIFAFFGSFAMPILIKNFAGLPHGWTIISLFFAVPFSIFGIARFLLLPELPGAVETEKKEKVSAKESLKALFQNKYALLYGVVMCCWAMYNSFATGSVTYYFQFVVGDISKQSIMSFGTLLSAIVIIGIPKIVERFGKTNTVRIGLAVTVISQLTKLLMPTNAIWIAILQFIATCGIMCLSFMKPLLNIDCMTYGKWKTGNSVEAAYSSINSLADKIGLGIGSFLLGAILQFGKYDGALATQQASAVFTIKMLFSVIPALVIIIALVAFSFYNVEKKLPQIQKELEERV